MSMQSPRDLREWQQAVERGLRDAKGGTRLAIDHANSKTDEVKEDITALKDLTPTAPITVTYQTATYIDQNKRRRGKVTVDFPDVTLSTTAEPIGVSNYELSGQDQGDSPLGPWRSLAGNSESTIDAFDFNPGSTWKFRVRAIGGSAIRPGEWSSEQTVTIVADTTAPPQPSTPVLTVNGGAITVKWDGLAAGGGTMPGDFDRIDIAFGMATSPTTVVGSLYATGLFVQPKQAYNTPHYFRFRAFDTSGNASAWSAQATGIPTPLVDADLIISHLDAAETEIVNIGNASILNGAINSAKLADNAVSQAKLQDQIVSLAKLDTSANNKIQKGVDDAFAAQTTANTAAANASTAIANAAVADGKAGTAQTAADAARAVVDAKVAAGATLNVNGMFDVLPITALPLGWTFRSNAQAQVSATTARSGTGVLKCTPTTSAAAYAYTDYIASATGRVFYLEYWVRLDQAVVAGNENLLIGAYFTAYDTSGASSASPQYGSTSPGTLYPQIKLSQLSTSAWTKFAVTYTVGQANNIQMRFGPRLPQLAVAGNTFEVDGFRVVDMTEAQSALDAAAAAQAKADQAFSDAYDANVAAGQAQTSANGKNNVLYLASLPSGAGFADGDTVFIRTAPGAPITAQYKWNKTGPSAGNWESQALGHQVIASLDMGKASVGELNGSFIKAFSLDAQTLKIGSGTNLFPDPKMLDMDGWATVAGLSYGGTGTGKNGQGSMLVAASATQVGQYYSNGDTGKRITVSPNSSYRLTMWVKATSVTIPVGGVAFFARTYPLDGSAFTFTTPSSISNNVAIAPGVWTEVTGVVTTGATPSSLIVGMFKQSAMTGEVRFSDPVIEVMGVGRLIVDGTIQGNHVAANSIAARHITVTDLTNFAPSLAESPTDWTLTNQMTISTTGLDPSGYRFNVTDAASESRAYGPYMAVTPGENLWLGATLYRGSSTIAAYLRYYFYDANKTLLAGGSGTQYVGVPQSSTSNGGTRFEGGVLVPAGAAYTRWTAIIAAGTGQTGFYNITGRRRLAAELVVDGTITSNMVATNGITAQQILVGDFQNFAIGSDFEDPAAVPWTLDPQHVITTAQKKSGTRSLSLTASAGIDTSTFVGDLRVKEGEQYYFKLHAYIDATFNGTSGNSKLRISDQTGTPVLGTVTWVGITRSAWTTTPLETTVTVPAGVTSLKVTLVSDNTAGTAYIDDIQIRRVSEASLIMNLGVEKLVATGASIQQATIDQLWSDVVRSRRMTTDMLAVGRGVNGIIDEFFEQADTKTYRNTLAGGWGAWGTSAGTNLNIYTQPTLTAGTSRSFYWDTVATYDKTSYIPVEPGQVWRLSMQYTSGTSGPRATIRTIKRDGTTAYTSVGWTKRDGTSNTYGAAGSIQTLERVYTVPADVAYVMPAVQFESTCTSATVYGGATFTNMMTSSLVVDGAITTRNLTVTQDMFVALLNTKKIKALDIDTNDLSADTGFISNMGTNILTADSITSTMVSATAITSKHTITGATIQTTATASRGLKLTSASLKGYNSTGVNTFTLDAASGDVTVSTLSTGASGARVKVWDDFAGRAQADFYTDGTGQHGSIYTEPQVGNGGYVTNVMHYTGSPTTTTNWTSRLTLFADQTWALGSRTAAAQITGDGSGQIFIRGKMIKNNGAATTTETFLVGVTAAQSAASGTVAITYAAPVPSGTRTVVATADASAVAQVVTQSASGSGVTFAYSGTASSNLTVRFLAVWST